MYSSSHPTLVHPTENQTLINTFPSSAYMSECVCACVCVRALGGVDTQAQLSSRQRVHIQTPLSKSSAAERISSNGVLLGYYTGSDGLSLSLSFSLSPSLCVCLSEGGMHALLLAGMNSGSLRVRVDYHLW